MCFHHRRQLASSDWTSGWIGLIGQFVGLCLNLPWGQIRSDRLPCCLIWCCGRRLESILPHGANDTTIVVVTCQPENKPWWVLLIGLLPIENRNKVVAFRSWTSISSCSLHRGMSPVRLMMCCNPHQDSVAVQWRLVQKQVGLSRWVDPSFLPVIKGRQSSVGGRSKDLDPRPIGDCQIGA